MCSKFHVPLAALEAKIWLFYYPPYSTFSSFFSFSFNESWSIRIRRLKKAAYVKHFFISFTFINTKRNKKKTKKKRKNIFSKNVYTIEAIQWTYIIYLILLADFFHTLFICLDNFFWLEIANISVTVIARCSSKEK